MSSRIGIFVATMTGLAELCAEEVQNALQAEGYEVDIRLMDDLDVGAFDALASVVIVSSTYGHGDIPDNGQAFYEALRDHADLAGTRFAVFALGDRTYADTFCHAGDKWDQLLASKGASRIAPLLRHDASSGTLAEDIAGEWAAGWASQLRKAA
jgi:MioC protein